MMYQCYVCGSLFEEPLTIKDYQLHRECSGNPVEYFYNDLCPFCGAEEIEDYMEEDEDDTV